MQLTEALEAALELYTPVDRSVLAALTDDDRRRHTYDLAKRLVVASELSCPGSGGSRALALLAADRQPADLTAELDALIEFGCALHDLSRTEEDQVRRGEVREEVLHFDRIMDLEALCGGRSLKRRREFLWDAGPLAAAERMLTLLHERRVERGIDRAGWFDLSTRPAGTVRSDEDFVTLVRAAEPELVIAARGPAAERAVHQLEELVLRHPLGNAVGLLDYLWFISGQVHLELAAAVVSRSVDGWWCDIWAAMDAQYVVVRPAGFRQVVHDAGTLAGQPLGSIESTYDQRRIQIEDGDSVLLVPAPSSDLDDIETRLNTPNRAGKIFLQETARRAFPGTQPLRLRPKRRRRRIDLRGDEVFVEELADGLCSRVPGRLHLSLEAGHVHSDRAMGSVQLRGLALGAYLRAKLLAPEAADRVVLELTPMIDDDHVVNRISYGAYRDLLDRHGFPADELILESSPIVNAIAVDLLKRAVRSAGDDFSLEILGDNLYLTSTGLRLELIQDVAAMRLGCVLFDTALGIYRTDRAAMQRLFFAQGGIEPTDIHRAMTDAYDARPDPLDRTTVRDDFDHLWRPTWTEVLDTCDLTPYLDLYMGIVAERHAVGDGTVILNVLENYYEPLERKVVRISELLGLPMALEALMFAPYGEGLRLLQATSPETGQA
jgi:hypothetical protein